MGRLIAVTGKGGTGKSTVSALLIGQLLKQGIRPVLAVDADPNSTLAPLLGVVAETSISDAREDLMAAKDQVSTVPKQRILETRLADCLVEAEGFDLLAMGRPEGKSCYCYVNNLLREALATFRAGYRATVVDNEAGMEHLSRMNTDSIDCLLTVSEPTAISARSAARIAGLADELSVAVGRRVLVWNKVSPAGVPDKAREILSGRKFDAEVLLPADEAVARLSEQEESALAAEVPEAFDELLKACNIGSEASG